MNRLGCKKANDWCSHFGSLTDVPLGRYIAYIRPVGPGGPHTLGPLKASSVITVRSAS